MYQIIAFKPFISFHLNSSQDQTEFNISLLGSIFGQKSALFQISNYSKVETIRLSIEGFDIVTKDQHGSVLNGIINLEIKYLEEKNSEFNKLIEFGVYLDQTKSWLKTENLSNDIAVINNQIKNTIKEEFLDASYAFEQKNKFSSNDNESITSNSAKQINYKEKNLNSESLNRKSFLSSQKYSFPVKFFFFSFLFLTLILICAVTYNQYNQAKMNKNISTSYDPTTAKNEQEMLDAAFKEHTGIDRKKLTNDLSCFKSE